VGKWENGSGSDSINLLALELIFLAKLILANAEPVRVSPLSDFSSSSFSFDIPSPVFKFALHI
jgi:hypothetical protein